jgi:hypothetical protein
MKAATAQHQEPSMEAKSPSRALLKVQPDEPAQSSAVAPSGQAAEEKVPTRSHKRRQRRRDRPRSKTIAQKRLTRQEMMEGASLVKYMDYRRPRNRCECATAPRPCPFVSCKHHLYLDVNPDTGSIKLNFPHLEVSEMAYTCALDVAAKGGITLEEVGEIMNLTRERIRQVEVRGLLKMKMSAAADGSLG